MTSLLAEPALPITPIIENWRGSSCEIAYESLPPSGSRRRFLRLRKSAHDSAILVDARNDEPTYLSRLRSTTDYLTRLGIRVPRLYSWDEGTRCALVEDLGENCYALSLQQRGAESCRLMFERTLCDLARLAHTSPSPESLPMFNESLFVRDTTPFLEHFMQARASQRARWQQVWRTLFREANFHPREMSVSLGDIHIENLFDIENRCAFIDFHDARYAPRCYDTVCLLEDGLWSMPEVWRMELWDWYCRETAALQGWSARRHYGLCALHRSVCLIGVLYKLLRCEGGKRYGAWLLRMAGACASRLPEFPLLQDFFEVELEDWQDRIALAVEDSASVSESR